MHSLCLENFRYSQAVLAPSSKAGVGDGASGDGVVVVARVDWGIIEVSLTVLSLLLL